MNTKLKKWFPTLKEARAHKKKFFANDQTVRVWQLDRDNRQKQFFVGEFIAGQIKPPRAGDIMSASQTCKAAGLTSLKELSELSTISVRQLYETFNVNRQRFDGYLLGALATRLDLSHRDLHDMAKIKRTINKDY